ncbi:MAG: 3-phosphoshikimate 1-carboxyvinyltransferase [Clostridiales bacterium]|nr:3-phosphoshikimate 1-carboxyvinyltransferase [Clostridiales bacterium]
MNVKIEPSTAYGNVLAPPSKSFAHRALICAALADGTSVIKGVSHSQDMLATIDCLKALGAEISHSGEICTVNGIDIENITGATLNCRECGSTLRFLIPLAMLSGKKTAFTGSKTLLSRPLDVYKDLCKQNGIEYIRSDNSITINGKLKSGHYRIQGNISSQFVSGLLFILPLLDDDSVIEILPPLESLPYIDMTINVLKRFGVDTVRENNIINISGGQKYRSADITVEGDYSNAAFFEALNYAGGNVTVSGLDPESLQGDKAYIDYFRQLKEGTPTLDLSHCPDLGPVCMAVAAAQNGAVFTGTKRLKIKESDRCSAIAEELLRFGIKSEIGENSMVIFPSTLKTPKEPLNGHNDHRIVMAMAVLCTVTGGIIEGAEAVNKSFPNFFDELKKLNTEVSVYGMDK